MECRLLKKLTSKKATIVTSHFTDPVIRSLASRNGLKILPKSLASEIPIKMAKT